MRMALESNRARLFLAGAIVYTFRRFAKHRVRRPRPRRPTAIDAFRTGPAYARIKRLRDDAGKLTVAVWQRSARGEGARPAESRRMYAAMLFGSESAPSLLTHSTGDGPIQYRLHTILRFRAGNH